MGLYISKKYLKDKDLKRNILINTLHMLKLQLKHKCKNFKSTVILYQYVRSMQWLPTAEFDKIPQDRLKIWINF